MVQGKLNLFKTYVGNHRMTRGAISSINFFKGTLNEAKMKSITNGSSCGLDGDLLSWKDMKWNIYGAAKIKNISNAEICKKPNQVFTFNSIFTSLKSCNNHCLKFQRSKVVTSRSQMETNILLEEVTKIFLNDDGAPRVGMPGGSTVMWFGITDDQKEGEWFQLNNKTGNKIIKY